MHFLIIIIVIVAIIYIPQLWVSRVLSRYNRNPEANFPGNGAEFARHLLDRYELQEVGVEATEQGDHYDPGQRVVRLTQDKFEGKTLTAITVAAHECGHAMQHAASEPMFILRSRLATRAIWAQRLGSFLLFTTPLVAIITKAPVVAVLHISGAILVLGFAVIMHLITLPVEIDASFKKALPLLKTGYLNQKQLHGAEKILRAAAFTYVAASLSSLLNFWRWFNLLRR